jgi:hypothetical protein
LSSNVFAIGTACRDGDPAAFLMKYRDVVVRGIERRIEFSEARGLVLEVVAEDVQVVAQ